MKIYKYVHLQELDDYQLPVEILDAHYPLMDYCARLSLIYNQAIPCPIKWVERIKEEENEVIIYYTLYWFIQLKKKLALPK